MWKVLGPLILLVIVLLFQLQLQESFVTSSTSDASGNITDASGTVLTSSGAATTISLTLADLLSLFKASSSSSSATTQANASNGGSTTTMYYSSTTTNPPASSSSSSSSLSSGTVSGASSGSTVDGISNTNLLGSPYTPAQPLPNEGANAPCSDSAAQGVEFQNALQDYIKKDEIPCYGCTL